MTNNIVEYYMNLPYKMEIIPDEEEGGFTAKFPDLPGCLTCAETLEGLIANVQDAKKAWYRLLQHWISSRKLSELQLDIYMIFKNYYLTLHQIANCLKARTICIF